MKSQVIDNKKYLTHATEELFSFTHLTPEFNSCQNLQDQLDFTHIHNLYIAG